VDGGARGNPGPAAYGVVLREAGGATLVATGKYVGRATNNVAEYYGLIAALDAARERGVTRLRVESDSELMVRQMQGRYRVKSPDLRPLHERAVKLSREFEYFDIAQIPREKNREADRLVNAALDGDKNENRKTPLTKGVRDEHPGRMLENRGEQTREQTVRARYADGGFRTDQPVELPEGTEVFLTIRPIPRRNE